MRTCCAAEANAHLLRSRNGKGRTSAHLLRTNAYAYMGRTGFRFYIRFSAAHKCVLMAISAHLWGLAEAGIRTHGLGDSRGIYRRAKRHAFFFSSASRGTCRYKCALIALQGALGSEFHQPRAHKCALVAYQGPVWQQGHYKWPLGSGLRMVLLLAFAHKCALAASEV